MHTHPRTIVLCFIALLSSTSVAQLGPSPTEIPVRTGAPIVQDQIVDSESARVRPAIDEMLMARAREGTDPVSPNVDVVPSEGSLRNELRERAHARIWDIAEHDRGRGYHAHGSFFAPLDE